MLRVRVKKLHLVRYGCIIRTLIPSDVNIKRCVVWDTGLMGRTSLTITSDSVLPYSIHDICTIDQETIEKVFNELEESLLSLSLLRCTKYSIRFTVIHGRKDSMIVEVCNVLTAESRLVLFHQNEDTYKIKLQRKIFEFLIGYSV